jgi:peptide deformylase
MILPLAKYPDKILRTPGERVSFPLSKEQQKLIKNMLDTVRAENGIGLAAPQVKQSWQIIIINLEHHNVPAFVLINPEITEFSKKKTDLEEGCLSIPGVYGMVSRPEKVKVRGQNINGEFVEFEADALLAKVLQHEIDHINGILIVDKIKKYTKGEELVAKIRE